MNPERTPENICDCVKVLHSLCLLKGTGLVVSRDAELSENLRHFSGTRFIAVAQTIHLFSFIYFQFSKTRSQHADMKTTGNVGLFHLRFIENICQLLKLCSIEFWDD
jgi:hypothetical protein